MTTLREVITLAMKEAGVLGLGQTLNAEDTNDGFKLLSNMVAQWQRRRWLEPSLQDIYMPGNGLISNRIGDGQYWNVPRPDKIQAGYVIQLSTAGSTAVSLPLFPIFSYEDYVKIAIKNLNTLPSRFFYDAAFPYGNVFIWPIPNEQYEVHLIIKSQLGFSTTITAASITTAGAAYTDGAYLAVPIVPVLFGTKQGESVGTGATANITVAGGIVTIVTILNGGEDFKVGDLLTVAAADIGGTGAGFTWTVTATEANLDSNVDMPPEFEEALHYNLAMRLFLMYQQPINPDTKKLAKGALNTIRQANAQISTLMMPRGLTKGRSFNLYNADGY